MVLSRGCDFPAPVTCKIGNIVSWKPENKHHGHWLTRITGGCGEIRDQQTNSGSCHGRTVRFACELKTTRPDKQLANGRHEGAVGGIGQGGYRYPGSS